MRKLAELRDVNVNASVVFACVFIGPLKPKQIVFLLEKKKCIISVIPLDFITSGMYATNPHLYSRNMTEQKHECKTALREEC